MRAVLVSTALVLGLVAAPAGADRARHLKPSAPVTVTLSSRPGPEAGAHLVVLDAVTTRDVPAVELRLGGESVRFGATRAGQHRRLVARIAVAVGAGSDVIGSARVGAAGHVRARTAMIRIGTAAPEKPQPFVLRTVNGKTIAEVRE